MALPELMTVDVGGTPIAVRDSETDGPALVLLHGLGGSSQSWAFQFRALGERYRVIAWEMPGYGASGGFAGDAPTVEHYAAALDAVLDLIEVGRVHVVGQSVAALIGASYAADNPERVLSYSFCQGLTGLGGLPADERERARRERIDAMREIGAEAFAEERGPGLLGPDTPPMIAQLAVTIMKRVPVDAYCQAVEMMAQTDFFAIAPRLSCPSLVIAGEHDPVSPPTLCGRVRAALGDGPLVTIEGAGHYGCMENPAAVNAAIERFVREHDR